jgi:membrane associated rhomboid family serine protease
MSNIHGLDGLGRYAVPEEENKNAEGEVPEFLKGMFFNKEDRTEPRNEKFCQTLRQTFCPTLTIRHFTAIISIIQILTLIVCFLASII